MKYDVRKLTVSAVTAAVVFAVTWTIRIPVPGTSGGYVNMGDSVIYLAAFLLGGPLAAAAAAVGSALADAAAGAAIYVPATFVIKGLMGLFCGYFSSGKSFSRFALSCAIGGAIMALGYALYETAVFGIGYAVASLPFNVVQWVGGGSIAVVLFPAVKRLNGTVNL